MTPLRELLTGSPYQSYTYAYPHKTAYRPIEPARTLREVWADEDRSALFLYVHVPFCEMRCGFCNLFTMAKPGEGIAAGYVGALERQAKVTREALGPDARYARAAIGGGTPTQLDVSALTRVFDLMEGMGADLHAIPTSCETSPETSTPDKIALMKARGVDRVSVGVQSFSHSETRALRRPQPPELLHRALSALRDADFPLFNIDLIYGIPDQTAESWEASLQGALAYEPTEIFLYPLYVRPLTGLGNSSKAWDDERLALYEQGRAFLLARGYVQHSMRLFRRADARGVPGPVYCCQTDGMVGLGPGARAYTRAVHYSTDYAVGRRGVVSIIEDYASRTEERFAMVDYGFVLDAKEQRHRMVAISVLSGEGLDDAMYRAQFGESSREAWPQLEELVTLGLATREGDVLRLTPAGQARADVIGPWLYSEPVQALMTEYELR